MKIKEILFKAKGDSTTVVQVHTHAVHPIIPSMLPLKEKQQSKFNQITDAIKLQSVRKRSYFENYYLWDFIHN